jgi:hypothetical protein
MSRTDKDAPHWVQAEWFVPVHTCQEYGNRYKFLKTCTLPSEVGERKHFSASVIWRQCYWWPEQTYRTRWRSVPRWTHYSRWYDPEQVIVRMECVSARKEYRATGEVDTMPTTRYHRHNAQWWD